MGKIRYVPVRSWEHPRSYALSSAAVAAGPRPSFVTQEQYDTIVPTLVAGGMDPEMAESLFKVRAPRAANASTRALRAVGAGGTCPYFGLDFVNDAGVHHLPNCGFDKDGHFAKAGQRSSAGKPGSGFEGHMEWVNATDPKVILAAKKAAKAKTS